MTEWQDWKKRKETKQQNLLGKIEENCYFCAHCDWYTLLKTNPKETEEHLLCNRIYNDGQRDTIEMAGHIPEKCEHFMLRSKYA